MSASEESVRRCEAAVWAAPPFAAALAGRVRRFAEAFERVVLAQVEISAVNTVLTAVYLFGIPGVVLAPILYPWVKGELREKGMV